MNVSIRNRIRWSFYGLASVFFINAAITTVLLNDNRKRSAYVSEVIDPSLEALGDFNKMMIESKMYATNWVFLRSKQNDKDALKRIHDSGYRDLKSKLDALSSNWNDENTQDSLTVICRSFEELIGIEKEIMASLQTFSDYDDPVRKFHAERIIEDKVLPVTDRLTDLLNVIISAKHKESDRERRSLDKNAEFLRMLITLLAIGIAISAFILTAYLTRSIVLPIYQISNIINLLGKGIIKKVTCRCKTKGDEISEMVTSVDNLSDKLLAAASFAQKVGLGNFDAHYKPLSEEDTLGKALIAMRDNLKASEGELKENIGELKKRNMELDKFVYSVSHDLRAPLRSILGVVELSEDMTEDGLMKKHFDMIKSSIHKLDGFILDILNYSRNSRLEVKKEDINFKEILNDAIGNLKYMGNNNREVDIKVNVSNGVCFTSDKSRIAVILNNLVSNAIRYQNPSAEHPFVEIGVDLSETEAKIRVKDNGIGIPMEHQRKVFDMFYRVSSASVGSGLGLYIVKETLDKLNGRISMTSELGVGTMLDIYIPNNKK